MSGPDKRAKAADVPGAHGAPAQDGSGLQVPAGAARRAPGNPAPGALTERVFSKFLGTKGDHGARRPRLRPAPAELPAVLRPPVRHPVGVRLAVADAGRQPPRALPVGIRARGAGPIARPRRSRWPRRFAGSSTFTSTYGLSQMRQGLAGKGERARRAHPPVRRQRAGHPADDQPRHRPRRAVRRPAVSASDRVLARTCPSCR